jgi:hypothetical protein
LIDEAGVIRGVGAGRDVRHVVSTRLGWCSRVLRFAIFGLAELSRESCAAASMNWVFVVLFLEYTLLSKSPSLQTEERVVQETDDEEEGFRGTEGNATPTAEFVRSSAVLNPSITYTKIRSFVSMLGILLWYHHHHSPRDTSKTKHNVPENGKGGPGIRGVRREE